MSISSEVALTVVKSLTSNKNPIPALLALLGMCISFALFISKAEADSQKMTLVEYFIINWPYYFAAFVGFVSSGLLMTYNRSTKVQDVDNRDRLTNNSKTFENIDDYSDIHIDNLDYSAATSFKDYFVHMTKLIIQKSKDADEKGSILLDKGLDYSRNGIIFYVLTIIIWQTVSYLTEFKTQYIYGVASCTAIFIFMQFLSAWSLKQYRAYTDTAAYLLRIKTMLDRYYLAYLAIIEEKTKDIDKTRLLELLEKEIQWPDTYLLKNKEVGFAREAMETMTMMAQSMRKEAQNVAKKSESRPEAK